MINKQHGCQIKEFQGENIDDLATEELFEHLQQTGLVLLRGYSIDLEDLETFSARFCGRFHKVGARQPIRKNTGDRFSSEVPGVNFSLFAHSEGAYRPYPTPPDLCFFNCVEAPDGNGGETMLIDGVEFAQRLSPDLFERFQQQGIIYQAYWDENRWQSEFDISNIEELQTFLANHPQIQARIDADAIEFRCLALAMQTSLSGELAFANGLLAHLPKISHPRWDGLNAYCKPTNRVFFGGGEEISEEIINQLIDIQDDIAVNHKWVENDLLIIDNAKIMHGRRMSENDGNRVIRSRFGSLHQHLK